MSLWATLLGLLLVAFTAQTCAAAPEQAAKNPLVNAGFEKGLSGWDAEGEVAVSMVAGTRSLRLGPGKAVVSQRYAVGGLRIIGFWATFKTDNIGAGGLVRVRCFDAPGRLLMEVRQGTDPKKTASPAGDKAGVYFKTQAHTAFIVVSIEKDGAAPGVVSASSPLLQDDDRDRVAHAPLCDLSQYRQPIWQGNTVYNETVLLESDGGKPACGTLLFTPTHILSVRDYGLTTDFVSGKDYTLDGRTITRTPDSRLAFVKDTDFPTGQFPWYESDSRHIVVTYTHDDAWRGPIPQYEGDRLLRTMDKLRHRRPLTIVADGDSITLGDNVSGYMQVPPYMPTWAELFVSGLKHNFGNNKITLYNTALGGMTSAWGRDNADAAVAALDPDLVLIAFGMNDFWSLSPEEFGNNIRGLIARVRARRPQAEFVLIASMRFDPVYTADPTYISHMAGYVTELRSLAGPGVGLLDMDAISAALYAAKKPKDLIANPMHPNDFLARWYAQGLVALLTPPTEK